eukprot:13188602-Ditylum_brightwellii.AAC.1
MVFPIIVIATKVTPQQEKRHYNRRKKSHCMVLECVETSVAAAYADQLPCCCIVPFQQKCNALS